MPLPYPSLETPLGGVCNLLSWLSLKRSRKSYIDISIASSPISSSQPTNRNVPPIDIFQQWTPLPAHAYNDSHPLPYYWRRIYPLNLPLSGLILMPIVLRITEELQTLFPRHSPLSSTLRFKVVIYTQRPSCSREVWAIPIALLSRADNQAGAVLKLGVWWDPIA